MPPIVVNDDHLETGHRFDALSVSPNGDVHIVWIDKRDLERAKASGQPYEGAALYHAVSVDGGRTFAANQKIKDGSVNVAGWLSRGTSRHRCCCGATYWAVAFETTPSRASMAAARRPSCGPTTTAGRSTVVPTRGRPWRWVAMARGIWRGSRAKANEARGRFTAV